MSDAFAQSAARWHSPRGAHHVLETLVLLHVGSLMVLASWAFGGNTETARLALSSWGSVGVLLTALVLWRKRVMTGSLDGLRSLWPLALFDIVIVTSLFNPSFRELLDGTRRLYIQDTRLPRWDFLPSTARPDLSLQALWFFNSAFLSCFNLVLAVQRRRALRALLLLVGANAAILAIFGTLQKLMGAKALYFGAYATPQPYFFASFIYHNHWGAFALLMTSALLGLIFYYSRRLSGFWRSPVSLSVAAIILLAVTIPLSTSRSSTLLEGLLLMSALVAGAIRLIRNRRSRGSPIARTAAIALVGIAATAALTYEFASPTIKARVADTREQLAQAKARGEMFPRQVLYRDTWNMAREKIWFGWGMGSYPTAFYHHNTQHESSDGPIRLFHDAHSDWLQSVADVGFVGTALLSLCAMIPLVRVRRVLQPSPLVVFLFAGCALVITYALLEFPFGNRAVVIAFWLCFFCALRYGELDGRADRPA